MNNFLYRGTFFLFLLSASLCRAQTIKNFSLENMLKDDKLVISPKQDLKIMKDGSYNGVSVRGIAWLTGVTFSTGSIDIDLRGRDVFQQSFLGIAFHGIDTITYDAVYFRPFNFHSADTLRRKHCVQYISQPDYPWDRLRKEHPLVYESFVTPSLAATAWFHAHIVVGDDEIRVYVNQSEIPSLTVKKLNSRTDGLIGLWTDSLALNGDFANLVITPAK